MWEVWTCVIDNLKMISVLLFDLIHVLCSICHSISSLKIYWWKIRKMKKANVKNQINHFLHKLIFCHIDSLIFYRHIFVLMHFNNSVV